MLICEMGLMTTGKTFCSHKISFTTAARVFFFLLLRAGLLQAAAYFETIISLCCVCSVQCIYGFVAVLAVDVPLFLSIICLFPVLFLLLYSDPVYSLLPTAWLQSASVR